LASGLYGSVEEVLTAALARLPHNELRWNRTAVERMIEFSRTHSVKLPVGETVEALVREMRMSQSAPQFFFLLTTIILIFQKPLQGN
jgi:hypothetical protein